jgi:hypothetical protein
LQQKAAAILELESSLSRSAATAAEPLRLTRKPDSELGSFLPALEENHSHARAV